MTDQDSRPGDPGVRFLVAAASFVVVVAGLRAATQLILPFLVSVFLAIISLPLLNWLHRKKVPPPLAIVLTVMAAVAVMAVMVLVVRQSVNEFANVAPLYQARLQELVTSVVDRVQGLGQGLGIQTSGWDDFVNPGVALDLMGGTLGAVAGLLSNTFLNTFLVLLTVIFILLEAAGFSRKLSAAFGDERVHLQPFERITRQVQNYLGIKTLVSLATGVAAGVWVAVLGLDFPLLWGLLAFIFNYIPNLGSVLAGVPPVLLADPSARSGAGRRGCARLPGHQHRLWQLHRADAHGPASRSVRRSSSSCRWSSGGGCGVRSACCSRYRSRW